MISTIREYILSRVHTNRVLLYIYIYIYISICIELTEETTQTKLNFEMKVQICRKNAGTNKFRYLTRNLNCKQNYDENFALNQNKQTIKSTIK